MSYTPTNWIDEETPVNAENLNKLEAAVQANSETVDALTAAVENYTPSWNDLTDRPFYEAGGEEVLFAEQTIASTEFSVYPTTGKYTAFINPAPFVPEVGETYRVVWDGVEYTCAAQDGGALIEGATFIGAATLFGLAGNNEPFIIGGQATSPMNVIALNDTEATEHTVAIYQDTTVIKTLDAKFLPMDAIDARIEEYISAALEGDY